MIALLPLCALALFASCVPKPTARGLQPLMAAQKRVRDAGSVAELEATIGGLSRRLEMANVQVEAARREADAAQDSWEKSHAAALEAATVLADAKIAKLERDLEASRAAFAAELLVQRGAWEAMEASTAEDKNTIEMLERDLEESRAAFEAELLVQRGPWDAMEWSMMEAAIAESSNNIERLERELAQANLPLNGGLTPDAREAAVAVGGWEQPETLAATAEALDTRAPTGVDPLPGVRERGSGTSPVVAWLLAAALASGIFFEPSQVDLSRLFFPPVAVSQFTEAVPLVSQRLSELLTGATELITGATQAPQSLIFPPP